MRTSPTAPALIAMVLAVWILASAITQIQPVLAGNSGYNGGGSSGSQGTGSGQGGSGLPFGNGLGFFPNLGNLNLGWKMPQMPSFNLPHYSFNYGKLFNYSFPKFNLSNLSSYNPTNSSFFGAKGGSSGGGSTSNAILQVPILNFMVIIIAALVAIVALTIFSITRSRRGKQKVEPDKDEELPLGKEPDDDPSILNETGTSAQAFDAEETTAPIRGWSSGNDAIRPQINRELPLTWGRKDPLFVDVPVKSSLTMNSAAVPKAAEGNVVINMDKRCNLLVCKGPFGVESKTIRAIDYSQDIVNLFRLNLLSDNSAGLTGLTAREIMAENFSFGGQETRARLDRILVAFEESYYGKKMVTRLPYEEFMFSLRDSIPNARAIVCREN